MGMFDNITCERELPNLPDELIWKWGSAAKICFQTKSIDNVLDVFKINKHGELLRNKVRRELISDGDPNAESIMDRLPQWNYIDEGWEKTKFNGDVIFYDHYDYEEKTDRIGWIDYKGVFMNGLLQGEIELIEHELPRNHTPEELVRINTWKQEAAERREKRNQLQIQIIEEYKSKIQDLEKMQDFVYQGLLEKLSLNSESRVEEWIFDYVYNDNQYGLEYIKEKLFA